MPLSFHLTKRARVGAVLVLAGLISAVAIPTANASTTAPHTVAFGTSGLSNKTVFQDLETKVGRSMAVARVYVNWDTTFPNPYHKWLHDTGHVPMLSVLSRTDAGVDVPWRTVADAQPGSAAYNQLVTWATRIKAWGGKVYVAFNHEPESKWNTSLGTSADFVAAYQKFVTVLRAQGATNAIPTWIMTAFSFQVKATDARAAAKWYPGDAYVDVLGADAYNSYMCDGNTGKWNTLASRITGFKAFGALHPTKPLWLPEYGSTEDPADAARKAQWITDAQNLFKSPGYEQFAGALYFDKYRTGTTCEWYVDSTPQALAAYTAMGQDAYYSGQG
jgi:hypothetical protein